MPFTLAATLAELDAGPKLFTAPPRQLALFKLGQRVYAVDNRCPHEGYPLVKGSVGEDAVITCNWHNWKFRLGDGACVLGGDDVRAYPVELRGQEVWVDLADPPPEVIEGRVLKGLRTAFDERDGGRITREIARLQANGLDPLSGVRHAIAWSHDRLEYGWTHCYAATADWLQLHDDFEGRWDAQLTCLTEAVDHMAHDALRHPSFPFPADGAPFDSVVWQRAIEEERRGEAEGMVVHALAEGRTWDDLEPAFAAAALAHYNDFGHAAIYVLKCRELCARLGDEVARWLAPALARGLAYATREDLIPEFAGYAKALQTMPEPAEGGARGERGSASGSGRAPAAAGSLDAEPLFGASVKTCLQWTVEHAASAPREALFDALLETAARNLLHYDLGYQAATDRPVSQNVGWLDFTHAITFANAVRSLCARHPALWRAGLLQMACFAGRNAPFLDRDLDTAAFRVDDAQAFFAQVREQLLDHGLRAPIFSAHLLKTARAVQVECATASPSCREALLAALTCFLHGPIKQKHALRNARQAIALVQRDFA